MRSLLGSCGLLGVVAAGVLAACGAAPSAPRLPDLATPATSAGRLVGTGVGHERLFLDCQGARGPTVVLEADLGVESGTWAAVQPGVASFARVCRYDRAGLGLSGRGPRPRDAREQVRELRGLLAHAHLAPPYVLVGAGFGALAAQLFARDARREVAGLVLVDGAAPAAERRIEALLHPDQRWGWRRALEANPEGVRLADLAASAAEVARAAPMPKIPLVVLRRGLPLDGGAGWPTAAVERTWAELQAELAASSPLGVVEVAGASHHRIAESQPELVIEAVRQVVARARAKARG